MAKKKSPFKDPTKFKANGIPVIPSPHDRAIVKYDDPTHTYAINGVKVPSVTQILDLTTAKDAIAWWAMRVGMAGVVALLQRSQITYPTLMTQVYDELITGVPVDGPSVWRGQGRYRKLKTELEAILLNNELSTNHIRDAAADQGTMIHDAITLVGVEDRIPDILDFEPAQRGYIQAFCRWWLEQEPEFHRQEVIVASPSKAYAGRFDLELKTSMPQRPKHCPIDLWDFKTSKGVYESHFEQLDLYEEAALAIGDIEQPYNQKGIIHLKPDGQYRTLVSPNPDRKAAIAAVELYHARQRNTRALPSKNYLKE